MEIRNNQVVLYVNGVKLFFTEEQLVEIIKKDFKKIKISPIEGIPFRVDPLNINRELFKNKRKDKHQEEIRQLILEAFLCLDKDPDTYGKPFKTLIPEKTWYAKNVNELRKLAIEMGDHMADWVEQAFEWAQRINNGETWGDLCNKPDTIKYYRLIEWKNGLIAIIGEPKANMSKSACDILFGTYSHSTKFGNTVPLIVFYD